MQPETTIHHYAPGRNFDPEHRHVGTVLDCDVAVCLTWRLRHVGTHFSVDLDRPVSIHSGRLRDCVSCAPYLRSQLAFADQPVGAYSAYSPDALDESERAWLAAARRSARRRSLFAFGLGLALVGAGTYGLARILRRDPAVVDVARRPYSLHVALLTPRTIRTAGIGFGRG